MTWTPHSSCCCSLPSPNFLTFKEPKNRFQGTNTARLCSLARRYDNPIPSRFLAPIDCLKTPALFIHPGDGDGRVGGGATTPFPAVLLQNVNVQMFQFYTSHLRVNHIFVQTGKWGAYFMVCCVTYSATCDSLPLDRCDCETQILIKRTNYCFQNKQF
jgi:hypothetical protein